MGTRPLLHQLKIQLAIGASGNLHGPDIINQVDPTPFKSSEFVHASLWLGFRGVSYKMRLQVKNACQKETIFEKGGVT
jgi:hypothetical protein